MKNKITNTDKPSLQSDEQASVENASRSTTQDNATLMRRRRLLKGLGAAPLVITLHNGAALAASSTGGCIGDRGLAPKGCVAGTPEDHDSFLRTSSLADTGGVPDGWSVQHPDWVEDSGKDLCLLSVDEKGVIDVDTVYSDSVVTTSCWCSFT